MTEAKTIRGLLRESTAALHHSSSPRLDAEVLLMHVTGHDRAWLFANPDQAPNAARVSRFLALIERRRQGEPVAYLTGKREFWNLNLTVSPGVLIPRPETELLVEAVLGHVKSLAEPRIVDLGTGSGAIALALASERPDARIIATDVSADALAVARGNAGEHSIGNVQFIEADWFGSVATTFDVVVSNPPYIDSSDVHLEQGDCRFEPHIALTPGVDGMAAIRQICELSWARLKAGGLLAVEHGCDQGPSVRNRYKQAGYQCVETREDLSDKERITLGFKAL